jgi:hypothetical protein
VGEAIDTQMALDAYRKAVARTPGWSDAHLALGNLLLKLNINEPAAAEYQAAQQLNHPYPAGLLLDLLVGLPKAELSATYKDGYIKADSFTIVNSQKAVIFMHPESYAAYTLRLPNTQPGEKIFLKFSAGISPDSWSQPGDGVDFRVDVQGASPAQTVFSQYLNPKGAAADRRWMDAKIDLSAFAGQDVRILLKTSSGPASDPQFDWAGWGEPMIVIEK